MENAELQEKWQEIIAAYRSSGLTAREWCETTGCTIGGLKYWIGKFNKAEKRVRARTEWAEVAIAASNPSKSSVLSIHVGAARIDVASGFDASLLSEVLRVVTQAC